jgi:hypothetical protein
MLAIRPMEALYEAEAKLHRERDGAQVAAALRRTISTRPLHLGVCGIRGSWVATDTNRSQQPFKVKRSRRLVAPRAKRAMMLFNPDAAPFIKSYALPRPLLNR